MICDACSIDRTVTVTFRDANNQIRTLCRGCGGAVSDLKPEPPLVLRRVKRK